MSININYKIVIKNQNNEFLEKNLLIHNKNEYRINYEFLYNKKLGKEFYYDPNKTIQVEYRIEDNYFIISTDGNKLDLDIDAFLKKFHEDVIVTESNSFDRPWETGLPYFNERYFEYRDGKIIHYDTTDKVVAEVKEIINKNENLYLYLSNLISTYNEFTGEDEKIKINEIEFNNAFLENNDKLLLSVIPRIWNLYICLSNEKKNDLDFNLKLMGKCPGVYIYLNENIQKNKEIVKLLIKSGLNIGERYRSSDRYEDIKNKLKETVNNIYKTDKNYIFDIVKENPTYFFNFDKYIEFDKETLKEIKNIFEKAVEEDKVPQIVLKCLEKNEK